MGQNQHPSDDTLEAYGMRSLPEMEVAPFERHLIICQLCRERFSEMDEFVTAMSAAAAEHRRIQGR
jgi:hypothetical protein